MTQGLEDVAGYDQDISAAFMQNHYGKVCIAFADPAYVWSDAILVNKDTGAVRAIVEDTAFLLGHVSDGMVAAFLDTTETLLTALLADGTISEREAPVIQVEEIRESEGGQSVH